MDLEKLIPVMIIVIVVLCCVYGVNRMAQVAICEKEHEAKCKLIAVPVEESK